MDSNQAVITCCHVIENDNPILYVSHDKDDGGWQFLCLVHSHVEKDARVISLKNVLDKDATISEILELPIGFEACREKPGEPWKKSST